MFCEIVCNPSGRKQPQRIHIRRAGVKKMLNFAGQPVRGRTGCICDRNTMKHLESGCTSTIVCGSFHGRLCISRFLRVFIYCLSLHRGEDDRNLVFFVFFVRKLQGSQSVDSIDPSRLHTSQPQNTRVPPKNKVAELLLP